MCVDLGDINGTMAKHFLNVADVYICFQQTGCESVAEHVRGDVLVDCGTRSVLVDHPPDRLIGERASALVDKKVVAASDFILKFVGIPRQNV